MIQTPAKWAIEGAYTSDHGTLITTTDEAEMTVMISVMILTS
jgi:hypothetical protein